MRIILWRLTYRPSVIRDPKYDTHQITLRHPTPIHRSRMDGSWPWTSQSHSSLITAKNRTAYEAPLADIIRILAKLFVLSADKGYCLIMEFVFAQIVHGAPPQEES
jgi:hypothetical protein